MNKSSMVELAPVLNAMNARIGVRPDAIHWGSSRTIMTQLSARVRAGEIGRILEQIETDSAFFNQLVDELTIRETYFFRDPGQFDVIGNQILPEIDSRHEAQHIVRCWSAGCSTGEEAYSLAILLRRLGFADRSQVIGTDISLTALARARTARYGKWSLRGESASFVQPYLRDDGDSKVVHDAIRCRVNFSRLNLADANYPLSSAGIADFDIILCRNVLIYFDERTIREVARRLFNSLGCGGWLLVGATDPILTDYAPFEVIPSPAGLLYRRPLSRQQQPVEMQEIDATVPLLEEAEVPRANSADQLATAREAFRRGDYAAVVQLTCEDKNQVEACILHIRALANLGDRQAAAVAEEALERHPLYSGLYYLLAHIRLLEGDQFEAMSLLRKAIYLSPSLAVAHFMLGSLLKHSGDAAGARRHLRNAMVLAEARPSDELLTIADGESAGMLANAARKILRDLGG
jgi:chemotaxis protein methyltransferase CheR